MIELINPWEIRPRNKPTAPVEMLVESMVSNGWEGRPILIVEQPDEYLALTGSHRIAAAREAGFSEIPCYVLDIPDRDAPWVEELSAAVFDEELLAAIHRSGDEDAFNLMGMENRM